jgi:hypothetical protein
MEFNRFKDVFDAMKKLQLGYPVSGPTLKPGDFRTRRRSVNNSIITFGEGIVE